MPVLTAQHNRNVRTLQALAVVLTKGGGEKAAPASIEKVRNACLAALMEGDDENVRTAAAVCASALATYMDSAAIRYARCTCRKYE